MKRLSVMAEPVPRNLRMADGLLLDSLREMMRTDCSAYGRGVYQHAEELARAPRWPKNVDSGSHIRWEWNFVEIVQREIK